MKVDDNNSDNVQQTVEHAQRVINAVAIPLETAPLFHLMCSMNLGGVGE